MIRNEKLDEKVYDSEHIKAVLSVMADTFPKYFADFNNGQLGLKFAAAIAEFEKEQPAYLDYFDEDKLVDYEDDPNAFKKHTRNKCPIIHRCLMSQDEVMDDYKAAFNRVSGRALLDTVRNISQYGKDYTNGFEGKAHEKIEGYNQLALKPLEEDKHFCAGVVGYGIQSNFLYMLYPNIFAYRGQVSVWALFFLSDKQTFDFEGGSEFVIYYPKYGTGEQNFLYPPELFGFYALKIFLILKKACHGVGITFKDSYRYIYLNTFLRHVAAMHADDIKYLTHSSDSVEGNWYGRID